MFVHEVQFPDKHTRWMHSSGRIYVVTGWSNLPTILEPLQSQRRDKYPPRIHYALEGHEHDMMQHFSCDPSNWYIRMVPVG
jgi:hypothetical protein